HHEGHEAHEKKVTTEDTENTEELFLAVSRYQTDLMPSFWRKPESSSGYAVNWTPDLPVRSFGKGRSSPG
ncbi:MAG: hypothetical protein QGH63_01065, partial [Rhodospirillales bacterium]|nr:hypothetical protein [Rhodospirillales bacterium]